MTDRHVCRIISCDPGKASGLGVFDLWHRPDRPPMWHITYGFHLETIAVMTVPWEDRIKIMRLAIQEAVAGLEVPLVVVNEHYTVTRLTQQSQDTQSLDVTGALMAILELLDVPHTYCEQLPSSAKLLVKDDVIRERLKLDVPRMSDHARDAARHALTWTVAYVQNMVQLTHNTEA